MQYRAISTNDRLPTLWMTYFIIIDGRKDIVTLSWIHKRVERYPECPFVWLEVMDGTEGRAARKAKEKTKFEFRPKKKDQNSSSGSKPYEFGSGRPSSD